ncbi:plasmid replication/partition related protein [uncultured Aquabacterium sp.]|uniref:plasmid replication/partition related protein n=1 Tax=uncultured Aquabacterium sp. TaxID=158753 RepID=UPI0030CE1D88
MHIVVNEELQAYIDPLTPEEHEALERSILAEGCRDALVLWGDVLVDGHNRYGICQKHGLPFQTVQHPQFKSMQDVHLWMIDQHLGRRSVSDFQRGVLALRKREILAERRARAEPATATPEPLKSRADIAKAARLSNSQVVLIEKIQKQAAPELVAAVKAGTISINAAAAVASLPAEEQASAALAGKDELKQAAKRVREDKRRAVAAVSGEASEASGGSEAPWDADATDAANADNVGATVQALQRRVAELTAENQALRAEVARLQAAHQG